MIVSAKLDLEQFTQPEQGTPELELDVFSYFYNWGYPVDEILEAYSVVNQKPEGENTGHLVLKIETLSKPIDEADVVADTTERFICSCKAFQFHHSVDLSERTLSAWEACKHIQSVSKAKKAIQDENQDTLV